MRLCKCYVLSNTYKNLIGKLKGRYQLRDLGVQKSIILKRTLQEISSGYGPVSGYCEYVNEHSGSMYGGEFLDQFGDYQLLKKNSFPTTRPLKRDEKQT